MAKAKAVTVYGMGGAVFDPAGGEAYLAQRLKAIGVDTGTSPYRDYDSQLIFDFLRDHGAHVFCAIFGDSLGANNGPGFARSLHPQTVDLLVMFQPSDYGFHEKTNAQGIPTVMVPANVKYCICFRNPSWVATGGLGYATAEAEDPSKTEVHVIPHAASHPDDWGPAQDYAFHTFQNLLAKAS